MAEWFWRWWFLNFVNVFSLFRKHLPLEKGEALHLNNLIYPTPKDYLCQVWLKLAQWFWRKIFFKFINIFSHFRNYLPLEKGGAFIWTNLTPLHPKMICAKFGWNWPGGSGEDDFSNLFRYFRNFVTISPCPVVLEKNYFKFILTMFFTRNYVIISSLSVYFFKWIIYYAYDL